MSLVHNGVTSLLPATESDFNGPPSTWHLCYLNPNTSWATSQISCGASTLLSASVKLNSDWNTGYCAQIDVHNGGTTTVPARSVSLAMNQSTLNNTWSATFQPTSTGNYQVTPLSWNASLSPGVTVSVGFCATKNGTNYVPGVTTP